MTVIDTRDRPLTVRTYRELITSDYARFAPPFVMQSASGHAGGNYYTVHDTKGAVVAVGSEAMCRAVVDRGDEVMGLNDPLELPVALDRRTHRPQIRDLAADFDPLDIDPLAI